jgi:hypothetical protein
MQLLGGTNGPGSLGQLVQPLGRHRPPARMIVCRGSMEAACARAAASRAGMTVAWIDEPAGYELAWMAASTNEGDIERPALARLYLVDGDGPGWIEIVTAVPAITVEPGRDPGTSISDDGHAASVWVDDTLGLVSIEWLHDGEGYVLTAQPRPWDPTAVIRHWKRMRYAAPGED